MSTPSTETYLVQQEKAPLDFTNIYNDFLGKENKFENSPSFTETKDASIIEGLFSLRGGVILNEKWDSSYLLSGRINAISEDFVECESIIDKTNKVTQIRLYPKILFSNLPVLQIGKTVKIKINEKKGSFRIDIIDGSNTGIEQEFESMSIWDSLDNFEMDNPRDLND